MVSSRQALANKTSTAIPESAHEYRSEYERLIDDLDVVEQQFKIGNVDDKIPNDTCTFEQKLDSLDELVQRHQLQLIAERPVSYYRFIYLLAECRQYFGRLTETHQLDLYFTAQKLYRELPAEPPAADDVDARAKLSSMVRVIVAGLEYVLLVGNFTTALSYGHKLLEFCDKAGLGTKSDLDAPLGVIYQFLARTLRARGIDEDCLEAVDYFYKSSEAYAEIALKSDVPPNEIIYARTRAAVSLAFGAGFLFFNAKSDLARAKDAIRPARLAFLRDNGKIGCKLYYHYFNLLFASILREEAGELSLITHDEPAQLETEKRLAQAKLAQASEIIKTCDEQLGDRPKYFIHVLFNRTLVHLYQGRDHYEDARQDIKLLFVECQSNPRWLANAFVLKSHLELREGDADTALADAIKAHSHAGNRLPVKIEALLARGQAQLARNKIAGARADVEKALQLNDGANLRLAVWGNLLLVEMALEQKHPGKAYEKLLHVGELMPSVRQGSLINQYRQLLVRLDQLQSDYFITSNTEDLHYKKLEEDLQRWLLQKAFREDKNVTRVARRLQVTKKTIYMWLDRYNMKLT